VSTHVRLIAFPTLVVLLGLAVRAPARPGGEPKAEPAGPQYNDRGELKRPTDYRTWVFVGANLGLQYQRDGKAGPEVKKDGGKARPQTFHNVYINPEAYRHYAKTGTFPDRTILVMEVFEALERAPQDILTRGTYPGKLLSVEAAVKNAKRPDGSKTDWAYYDFPNDPKAGAKAFPDAACYNCHRQHASDDNVWVQFYPTLREHQKAKKQ